MAKLKRSFTIKRAIKRERKREGEKKRKGEEEMGRKGEGMSPALEAVANPSGGFWQRITPEAFTVS